MSSPFDHRPRLQRSDTQLDQGVGLTPYSPLAKGRAARPWGEQTARSSADSVAKALDRGNDKPVVDAIHKIADTRGVPMAQIALAWLLCKPAVSCPIVGATRPKHLADAVAALEVKLTDDEVTALDDPYTAQDNYWCDHAPPAAWLLNNVTRTGETGGSVVADRRPTEVAGQKACASTGHLIRVARSTMSWVW